jgi:CysZ protein
MIRNLSKGILDYLEAFSLISKLKLWNFLIFVGIISMMLGIALFYGTYLLFEKSQTSIESIYPFGMGKEYIGLIFKYLGLFLVLIIGFLFYKYLVFIIFIPFLGPLSEKIEEHLTGKLAGYSFLNFKRFVVDIFRGFKISIRLIYKEMIWLIILFFIGLIPIFTPFIPIFVFIIQSFYAGYGNFDWALERYYNVDDRIEFIGKNKSLALGNGLAFNFIISIPLIGFFLAPALSVAAATISVISQLQKY